MWWKKSANRESPSKEENETVEDEREIANTFNTYFYEEIDGLKNNIDKNICVDPLFKLKEKMSKKNIKFQLKSVSIKTVKNAMRSMKNKRSSGHDKISQ